MVSAFDHRREAWRYAVIFWGCGGLLTVPVLLAVQFSDLPDSRPAVLVGGVMVPSLLFALAVAMLGRQWTWLVPGSSYVAAAVTTLAAWALGPSLQLSILIYMWIAMYAFAFLDRRHHLPTVVAIAGGYALLVSLASGYSVPALRVVAVTGTVLVLGAVANALLERVARAMTDEREARREVDAAHAELALANARLAERVDEQDVEMERLAGLRRFLSPQVADAVVNEGAAELLEAHRREIAVFFCDIRGFTAFAADVEPEEVIDLLSNFHDVAGRLVHQHDATVGGFTGDGFFAFFNDPLPCPAPAEEAVRLAVELRDACEDIFGVWRRRGFALGLGAGVALVYATLGVIGFDRRRDYTALGTVVNLAARLCAEAGAGEVLIDPRAAEAVAGLVEGDETGPVELKGIPRPVKPLRVRSIERDRA